MQLPPLLIDQHYTFALDLQQVDPNLPAGSLRWAVRCMPPHLLPPQFVRYAMRPTQFACTNAEPVPSARDITMIPDPAGQHSEDSDADTDSMSDTEPQ